MTAILKRIDNELSIMFEVIDTVIFNSLESIERKYKQHNLSADDNLKDYFLSFSNRR